MIEYEMFEKNDTNVEETDIDVLDYMNKYKFQECSRYVRLIANIRFFVD